MHTGPAEPITRRRFLSAMSAVGTGIALGGCRSENPSAVDDETPGDYYWSGIGFGIEMSMELPGVTASAGDKYASHAEKTIQDFERAFSLYQDSSELSILNRERVLPHPSPLFRSLLDLSIGLHQRTLGYYQPAVQGVWETLDTQPPSTTGEHWAAADLKFLEISPGGAIRLTNPLTRLSMNAIAQGFLADRVAGHLRSGGMTRGLLHFGETVAIGNHPQGRPWNLAVTGSPQNGETDIVGHVGFRDAGLAVSAQDATRNLIDPVARSVHREARVAAVVSSEGASVADAFATAFAVAPEDRWPQLAESLRQGHRARVLLWVDNQLRFEDPKAAD